jgi:hypothetical protein
MCILTTPCSWLRPAFNARNITAATFLLVAAGTCVRAQTIVPSDAVPAVAPPAGHDVVLNWDTGKGKSYVAPAYEVPGFLAALSVVDRITIPHDVYDSTPRSTWEHVHE